VLRRSCRGRGGLHPPRAAAAAAQRAAPAVPPLEQGSSPATPAACAQASRAVEDARPWGASPRSSSKVGTTRYWSHPSHPPANSRSALSPFGSRKTAASAGSPSSPAGSSASPRKRRQRVRDGVAPRPHRTARAGELPERGAVALPIHVALSRLDR
jgi:hypothetical protein